MATPTLPRRPALVASASGMAYERVSGNRQAALAGSASLFRSGAPSDPETDRNEIAKPWQIKAYRHVNICGEARYAATLFSAMAGRAEIGISEPQTLAAKAKWINSGPEVEVLAEIAPTVRERTKLIRDYMLHRTIAGECYLIARRRMPNDPGYTPNPIDPSTGKPFLKWADYLEYLDYDPLDYTEDDFDAEDPNVANPIWEIVGVTEIRKVGDEWSVRYDNNVYLPLDPHDPVVRMWNPDPADRREAWSPFRSMAATLDEIEFLTKHIFTQVRSRLMAAGVWFLPNNLTFAPPPPDQVTGGAEAIAKMNEAEQFMISLSAASMRLMNGDEVAMPNIVMADPAALAMVDQNKLIQFWKELDDKAMIMRSDAVRRFALGMDLPPEQVLGSSGLAVTGAGGSAGSVNHWGVWANEEQTISAHIEPALDDFVGVLTSGVLRVVIPDSVLVVGYDTATLRLRQDRSKESVELYDRGLLNADVTLRENGFDPVTDKMSDKEFKKHLLLKMVSGSPTPEQMNEALKMLGVILEVKFDSQAPGSGVPGRHDAPTLEEHPYEGKPREQHDHSPAPFSVITASAEALVLRALEKAGNRLLNDGKRGKDRDRHTPPHLAHLTASALEDRTVSSTEFDFTTAPLLLADLSAAEQRAITQSLGTFCANLYNTGEAYSRQALIDALDQEK